MRTIAKDFHKRVRLIEIARGNVERHLGDCESVDSLFSEAYTLAFDALADAGVDHKTACDIAQHVAQQYAQP